MNQQILRQRCLAAILVFFCTSGLALAQGTLKLPGKPKPAATQAPAPLPAPAATQVATAASSLPRTLDRIVAVVNGEVITHNELREKVEAVSRTLSRQGTQMPAADVLEKQVLERMIVDKATLQLANDEGLRVDDFQLDRAVQRVAESNSMTVQAFRDRLEREGTPFARFRDDLRKQILIERLRAKEVDDKIQVGEGEIDNYLAEQSGNAPGAAQEVDVAQILLRVPEQASSEQIERQRARAEDLYKQIQGGADFARLAASFSDAPDALSGGDLGWRAEDRLPQLFTDAIAPLAPGQTAKPVKSANGFHILKLVAKRGAGASAEKLGAAPMVQTRARHILIRVNELVSAQQAKERLAEIRQRIENKTATFEDMARAYSNDASASRGGELGTLYPGDTVPEFEHAMNALKVGEISEPVESPFGFHLIQVEERKNQEVAQDRLRLLARQAIRERKIDEAVEDWARQVRDRAYVEMRLDDK